MQLSYLFYCAGSEISSGLILLGLEISTLTSSSPVSSYLYWWIWMNWVMSVWVYFIKLFTSSVTELLSWLLIYFGHVHCHCTGWYVIYIELFSYQNIEIVKLIVPTKRNKTSGSYQCKQPIDHCLLLLIAALCFTPYCGHINMTSIIIFTKGQNCCSRPIVYMQFVL